MNQKELEKKIKDMNDYFEIALNEMYRLNNFDMLDITKIEDNQLRLKSIINKLFLKNP